MGNQLDPAYFGGGAYLCGGLPLFPVGRHQPAVYKRHRPNPWLYPLYFICTRGEEVVGKTDL